MAGVTADIADAAAPVPRLAQLVADRVGRGIISESLPKPGSSGIEIGEFQAMAVDWKGIDLQGPDGIIVAVDIARTVELGRASGRESGGQYVENWVVAGSLQKKRNTQD